MTRIDFYVLTDDASFEREIFACRLAEKAFRLGHTLYIYTDDGGTARRMDELLWTWRDQSFLPHSLSQPGVEAPILIGHDEPPDSNTGLLINLASQAPEFFPRCTRVAEIVGADAEQRKQSRERFRFYRDQGYAPETHNLGET